jgi:hypothetical protein
MSFSHAEVVHDISRGRWLKGDGPVKAALHTLLSGGSLVMVIDPAKSKRVQFLEQLVPALRRGNSRIVQAASPSGKPIDFGGLMDQVVGKETKDGSDRTEQFYNVLAKPETGEARVILIIDDAHHLTDETVHCLDLMVSFAGLTPLQLQLVLVGSPVLLTRLPTTGRLAADNAAARISLSKEGATPAPDAERSGGPAPFPAETDGPDVPEWPGAELLEFPFSARPVDPVVSPGAKADILASAAVRPRQSAAAGVAFALCAGIIIVGGGLAVVGLPEKPLDSATPLRLAIQQNFDRWLGRSDAMSAPSVVRPVQLTETVPMAAAPSARPPVAVAVDVAVPRPVERPPQPVQSMVAPVIIAPQQFKPSEDARESSEVVTAVARPPEPAVMAENAVPNVPDASPPAAVVTELRPAVALAAPPVTTDTAAQALPQVASRSVPVELVAVLLARGDALLATGDVVAARLMYERVAGSDSGPAALAMGMTYDPRFLANIGAQGIVADPEKALIWYRRAATLGSDVAVQMLRQLGDGSVN